MAGDLEMPLAAGEPADLLFLPSTPWLLGSTGKLIDVKLDWLAVSTADGCRL